MNHLLPVVPLSLFIIIGLLTSTFLTLLVLPIIYYWVEERHEKRLALSNVKIEEE